MVDLEFSAAPPASMYAGGTYSSSVVINNTSHRGSTAVGYNFIVGLVLVINGTVIYSNTKYLSLPANGSGNVSWNFTLPAGSTGSGYAQATLYNSAGDLILAQTAFNYFTVTTIPIVTVSLRAHNAPSGAVLWTANCETYLYCPFYQLYSAISWTVPANTPRDWVIFMCHTSGGVPISTPNGGVEMRFPFDFLNGRTYYWDFAVGQLVLI